MLCRSSSPYIHVIKTHYVGKAAVLGIIHSVAAAGVVFMEFTCPVQSLLNEMTTLLFFLFLFVPFIRVRFFTFTFSSLCIRLFFSRVHFPHPFSVMSSFFPLSYLFIFIISLSYSSRPLPRLIFLIFPLCSRLFLPLLCSTSSTSRIHDLVSSFHCCSLPYLSFPYLSFISSFHHLSHLSSPSLHL